MGGQAFNKAGDASPINCPRMSPDVYTKVASDVKSKIEALFTRVTIPREAPAKTDHGDVDFLVAGQISHGSDIWLQIEQQIGAKFHAPGGSSHSYAIEHPVLPDAYVQIDVELSPGHDTPDSDELFEWTHFMKSDSDLLQIVGVCHRPLGLTCNDKGLHLRVEEIEPYHKKKSLLFLTRKPNEAIEFYGFDATKYWVGFETEEELFDWVAQGRFFSRDIFESRTEKANDRSRQAKRPMYRRFVEEYMPSHPDVGIESSGVWNRATVLDQALDAFNKREEYEAMMLEHTTKEADAELWEEIRSVLPLDGSSLAMVIRSLKRWVAFQNGDPRITSEPMLETDQQPMWVSSIAGRRDELLAWVKDTWAEVKALEKARVVSKATIPLSKTERLTALEATAKAVGKSNGNGGTS